MNPQKFTLSAADLRLLSRRAVVMAMRELATLDDRRMIAIVRRVAAAVPRVTEKATSPGCSGTDEAAPPRPGGMKLTAAAHERYTRSTGRATPLAIMTDYFKSARTPRSVATRERQSRAR